MQEVVKTMMLLSDEKLDDCLRRYYEEHFGVRDTDIWYPCSGVNVRVFRRDEQLITLVSQPFTGEVKAEIEKIINEV